MNAVFSPGLRRAAALLVCLALAAACSLSALATTPQELQNQVNAAHEAYQAQSQALNEAQEQTDAAQATVSSLNAQAKALVAQINELNAQIEELTSRIAQLQQQIADKEREIADKQAEYDGHKADFKARLAAMQQLHDGGNIAMLAQAADLYQLLTFSEALKDISLQDSSTLDALEHERLALEQAKAELLANEQQLEGTKAGLEEKQQELNARQQQLADNLQQANAALSAAEAAEQAQETITAESKRRWDAALAEQEAYIRSQLSGSAGQSLSCGLAFQQVLPYYTRISTNFGDVDSWHSKPHSGADLAAPAGTPIYAAESGYVVLARSSSSYGNYVVLDHGTAADSNLYATLYAHMTSYCVCAGQYVNKGDTIGYVGNTGRSFGNHLHLELWRNQVKIDPLPYIPH